MPAEEAAPRPDKVFDWRKKKLMEAGLEEGYAGLLASDKQIDLHRAVALVRTAGPELAFRILF